MTDGPDVQQPRLSAPAPQVETVRLRAGQLPEVGLTADVLYRILASEVAAQRGVYGTAANTVYDLARSTGDWRLARRALEFSLAGGNLTRAYDAARLWALLAPNDPESHATELALAAANGRTEGLAAALRQRIDAAPDKAVGIGQALVVLSRLGDKAQALDILDEALSEPVRRLPAARLALSDVAHAAGDDSRAVLEARLALVADPHSEAAAQRLLEYGMAHDPQRAVADAHAFLAKHPAARKVGLSLVNLLTERQDYEAALAELDQMARRAPEDFDLLFIQAQVNYRAQRLDTARGQLEQFLDVQTQRRDAMQEGASDAPSAQADARILLSRIAEEQGRLDDAIAQLERIDDPSVQFSARMRQAVLRAKQGQVDQARALVNATDTQDDDERTQARLTEAQILRDAGRLDEAIAVLARADEQMPDTVDIKYELAMLYERRGDIEALERLLREVIALDPGHAHAYNALGYTLADRKQRLPEAQALIRTALDISPGDPFILDSMGWVQYRLGQMNAAIGYLRRAYALRPEAEIATHLAEVLWQDGQREEAMKLWREAAAMDASNAILQETLKRLGVDL